MRRKVRDYLMKMIREHGCIHISLIDPDKLSKEEFVERALYCEKRGSSAIMVGGSLGVSTNLLDDYLSEAKKHLTIPIILFPGSLASLSNYADAVWFLSVLNSENPYYIIEAQVQAAVLIHKRFKSLEPIPLAYIIVGEGKTVGIISRARPIPLDNVELLTAYALAAEYLNFDFIYFEAGSGAEQHMRPEVVQTIRRHVSKHIIIGGGVRDGDTAYRLARAGADIIVTGTIIERSPEALKDVIDGVRRGGLEKLRSL